MASLLILFAATSATKAATSLSPSTIVTIVIDDLGHYDTAVWNPNAPTPALKALADGGIRLGRHCTLWLVAFSLQASHHPAPRSPLPPPLSSRSLMRSLHCPPRTAPHTELQHISRLREEFDTRPWWSMREPVRSQRNVLHRLQHDCYARDPGDPRRYPRLVRSSGKHFGGDLNDDLRLLFRPEKCTLSRLTQTINRSQQWILGTYRI